MSRENFSALSKALSFITFKSCEPKLSRKTEMKIFAGRLREIWREESN